MALPELLSTMVLTQLLPALLLLQITRRQSRRLQTFHSMIPKIVSLYDCEFVTDKHSRRLKVVASTFGQAASLAYSQASHWEDKDRFELVSISLLGPVVVGF